MPCLQHTLRSGAGVRCNGQQARPRGMHACQDGCTNVLAGAAPHGHQICGLEGAEGGGGGGAGAALHCPSVIHLQAVLPPGKAEDQTLEDGNSLLDWYHHACA